MGPYGMYEEVRAAGGVAWRPELNAFVVVGYDDVRAALRDPRLSSAVAGTGPASGPLAPLVEVLRDQLFLMDPPRHRSLRKLVAKAFTPRSVVALEEGATQSCEALLAGFREGDLVERLAYPFPLQVIARILGIPAHEEDDFRAWSNAIAAFVVQMRPSQEVVHGFCGPSMPSDPSCASGSVGVPMRAATGTTCSRRSCARGRTGRPSRRTRWCTPPCSS